MRKDRVSGVINDSGAAVVSYAYDPYGNIRSAPGLDSPLAWANTVTHIGAMRDLQTRLYRLGVRWYDPNTGRFTTPDPTAQETSSKHSDGLVIGAITGYVSVVFDLGGLGRALLLVLCGCLCGE